MGLKQDRTGRVEHTLMSEALAHAEQARYFAASAVRDLQRGRHWVAEAGMEMAAMERHLHYEKWDTHEIAWRALNECRAEAGRG